MAIELVVVEILIKATLFLSLAGMLSVLARGHSRAGFAVVFNTCACLGMPVLPVCSRHRTCCPMKEWLRLPFSGPRRRSKILSCPHRSLATLFLRGARLPAIPNSYATPGTAMPVRGGPPVQEIAATRRIPGQSAVSSRSRVCSPHFEAGRWGA